VINGGKGAAESGERKVLFVFGKSPWGGSYFERRKEGNKLKKKTEGLQLGKSGRAEARKSQVEKTQAAAACEGGGWGQSECAGSGMDFGGWDSNERSPRDGRGKKAQRYKEATSLPGKTGGRTAKKPGRRWRWDHFGIPERVGLKKEEREAAPSRRRRSSLDEMEKGRRGSIRKKKWGDFMTTPKRSL